MAEHWRDKSSSDIANIQALTIKQSAKYLFYSFKWVLIQKQSELQTAAATSRPWREDITAELFPASLGRRE